MLSNKTLATKGGKFYLFGYNSVPMPELLVERFIDFVQLKRNAQPLINFWMWCLLNPNKAARYKLFAYLSKHRLLITPSGYFVTYRMVKSTTDSPNTGIYVDAHTGKFSHIIGQVSRMDRKDCDEDGARDCSKGLHSGSPDFIGISLGDGYSQGEIKTKAQGGGYGTGYGAPSETVTQKFNNTFGNQAVICLVNPMHVVSIPNSDTRKMRSCEIFIAKTTTPEEVLSHLTESDYLVFDNEYAQIEAEQIKAQLKGAKLENYTDGTVEELSGLKTSAAKKKVIELQNQLSDLGKKVMNEKLPDDVSTEEMMKIIQSRVKQVSDTPVIELPRAKKAAISNLIDKVNEKATKPKKDTPKVEKEEVKKPEAVPSKTDKPTPEKGSKSVKQVVDKALDTLEKEVNSKAKVKATKDKLSDAILDKDSKNKLKLIVQFILVEWEKRKKAKKSPKNFWVLQDSNGALSTKESKETNFTYDSSLTLLGNLDDLYNKNK